MIIKTDPHTGEQFYFTDSLEYLGRGMHHSGPGLKDFFKRLPLLWLDKKSHFKSITVKSVLPYSYPVNSSVCIRSGMTDSKQNNGDA